MFWKSKEVEPLPQEVLEILDDIKNYVGNPKMFSRCDVLTLTEGILYNKSGEEYILAHERSDYGANDLSFYVDGRKIFTADFFDKRRGVIWSVYNEAFNYLKIKEKDREENDEHAIAVQPEDGVREIIKDVMEFLLGGDADDTVIAREGVILMCNNVDAPRLAYTRDCGSWDEVVLSEKEKEVLAAFFIGACKEIKERKALDNSESALSKISAIIAESKK